MALQLLRAIARALSDPLSPAQVAELVVGKTFERFEAAASAVYLTDGSSRIALAASRGVSDSFRAVRGHVALAEDLPLTLAIRTGEPIWCETREALLQQFPGVAGSTFPAAQLAAAVAFPFLIDHHVAGGLAMSFSSERRFTNDEREHLLTVGDLAAHAIDRFRLDQRLRRMHEATPDGVGIFKPLRDDDGAIRDFRYLYVNPVVAKALGRTAEDVKGRTLRDLLPGIDQTPFWEAFRRVAESGNAEVHEQPYNDNGWQGSYRNIVVSLGDEIGVTYSDVSDRKRAEESVQFLAEASNILSSSLDYEATLASVARLSVPTIADWATVDMAVSGGGLHRVAVAHVDPTKVEFAYELGKRFPPEMDAPTGVPNVLRTGKTEMVAEITDELLKSVVHDEELLGIIRSLGLKSSMCVPIKAKGGVVGAITLILAESGRRYGPESLQLAEDLAQRASMAIENALHFRAAAEANQAKDDFLATVSHELRTPLNSILGWVQILNDDALPPERQKRALETIERNARTQNRLIEDLLDVSRIVSGKLRLEVEVVDVPRIVEAAIETVRPAASAKGIVLRQTVDPDAGSAWGDAGRLQQVVCNLLGNAVKFSAKGSAVQIVVRKRDSSIEIIVRDKGQGIDPTFLPFVFERFRQAAPQTTRVSGGLGLGLAIVRNLVELHGGTVTAESEGAGRGATFTVSLPISPLDVRSPASYGGPPALRVAPVGAPVHCPPELEGAHVLVVDDEPDARELVSVLLTRLRLRVSTAASADEAIRLVQELRPDVIVSDIGMPVEDGYSLVKRLRALPASAGGRTPAVALTAFARVEDRTKALVSGFNMHVPKPVNPVELIAVLASLNGMFSRDRAG